MLGELQPARSVNRVGHNLRSLDAAPGSFLILVRLTQLALHISANTCHTSGHAVKLADMKFIRWFVYSKVLAVTALGVIWPVTIAFLVKFFTRPLRQI